MNLKPLNEYKFEGYLRFLLENENDWKELNTVDTDAEPNLWYPVYGQKNPLEYPCVAIGTFDDFGSGYVYGFCYKEDFDV